MKSIHEILETAIAQKASDVIIKTGCPPTFRVDGNLVSAGNEPLTFQDVEELIHSIIYSATRDYLLQMGTSVTKFTGEELVDRRVKTLRDMDEIDLVFTIDGLVRVRSNLFLQRNMVAAALRLVPIVPQTIEELNLPPILKEWADQPHGLVIVTGPTGSGKSTTVAAMVDYINSTRKSHVITVEDPIEHVFQDKKSVINQREVGSDTKSYSAALRSVLRQTPDVIVIGEMRDVETMEVAITAGEVGHLVITTLHTTSAVVTVDRILNSFPAESRQQVALQLSAGLVGITSQRLALQASGQGRLPAVEIMTGSPTVKKMIEDRDTGELYSAIRDGIHFGMCTMNQDLERLCKEKKITADEAIQHSTNPAELKQILRKV